MWGGGRGLPVSSVECHFKSAGFYRSFSRWGSVFLPTVDLQVLVPKNFSKMSAFATKNMQAKYAFHLQITLPIKYKENQNNLVL